MSHHYANVNINLYRNSKKCLCSVPFLSLYDIIRQKAIKTALFALFFCARRRECVTLFWTFLVCCWFFMRQNNYIITCWEGIPKE